MASGTSIMRNKQRSSKEKESQDKETELTERAKRLLLPCNLCGTVDAESWLRSKRICGGCKFYYLWEELDEARRSGNLTKEQRRTRSEGSQENMRSI